MKGACVVAALLALMLTPALAGTPVRTKTTPDDSLKGVYSEYADMITSVLMQKEKNPENATKLLANLVGVTGAHIDALDHQGYTNKFDLSALTNPPIFHKLENITDTIGEAVAEWLPDKFLWDKFATNYTSSYNLGLTVSPFTGFNYAPCLISNLPVGAQVSATGISISPLGVYVTPEGSNFQPEGLKIEPVLIYIGATGENIQPQGMNVAPALISVSPVRDQIGAAGALYAPVGITVGVAAAPAPP